MALAAINVSIGQSLGNGNYNVGFKNGTLPAPTLTTLSADITAALLVAAADHDSTPELTTIQTDANSLVLAMTSGADVSVTWNGVTITLKNQLKAALRKVIAELDNGYGGLT